MRRTHHADLVAVLLVAGLAWAPAHAAQQGAVSPADENIPEATGVTATATVPPEFAGLWDYNHVESINILTGRAEQAPRSATQGGRGAGRTAGGGAGGGRGSGTGFGGGGGRGSGANSFGVGPTPEMMREQRDMSRDLLEVPESYTISIAETAVVFVDDLERERSYALDGSKQRYRLGASEFTARVSWNGTQLRKDIEGSVGFKMSETFFLSPDAKRLFVIVRMGQQGRNRQPVGFNRVYDRVERTTATDRVASR